ncbi:MAG: ABC transporter substrate-binding protein [Deltaproteobacteria bacterium]|nr:ABC transporter substrate-binding protein [Deltaproteobacteria bacterium]
MLPLILKGTLVFSVLWVLSWAAPAIGAETKKVTLGILQTGSQDFVHTVMEQQKLLQKYNIAYERVQTLNPPALHLMIAERKVDIGYGGLTAMARARAEGRGMLVIFGIFSPVNVVLVPKDSPIKSLAELKGKKVGNFGGPGSATTSIFMAIAKRWHGLDLQRQAELITAPGPALIGLLDRGDLAAALFGTTESLRFPLTGKYRVILDLSEEWEKRAGRAPAHVTITTNDEFAKAHPDILKRYLRAYLDAVKHIRSHPEVWDNYAKQIKLSEPGAAAALRDNMGPRIMEKWDREQIKVQQDFLEISREILGPKVLKEIPQGLMTDAYNP